MGDVLCGKCGEPWDFFGLLHGDVTKEEGQRILNGEGCPACKWGKDADPMVKCPDCDGWGHPHQSDLICDRCKGSGEIPKSDSQLQLERLMSIDDGTDLDPIAYF